MSNLKIGQKVLIHGYVDEIRKDTVIIRNGGGYFGTVESEILEKEPCEDCISRQAVIDIWHTQYAQVRQEDDEIKYKKIAYELPSVQPKRIKGKWIDEDVDVYYYLESHKCSICGEVSLDSGKFCSHCGSVMEDIKEEKNE